MLELLGFALAVVFLLLLFGSSTRGRIAGTVLGAVAGVAGSSIGIATGGGKAFAGTFLFGILGFIIGALMGNHAGRAARATREASAADKESPPLGNPSAAAAPQTRDVEKTDDDEGLVDEFWEPPKQDRRSRDRNG